MNSPAEQRHVLQGRVALVTGAASGIGKATATRLAAAGASVVVSDVDAEGAAKVAADLGTEDALGIAMDVSEEGAVIAGFEAARSRFGDIHIVVNNAGFAISTPLAQTTARDWDGLHAVLARGSFLVSREAAKAMIAQGSGGDIVYIVSKNAVFAGPGNIAYSAAKADQAHQVRLLAVELGRFGIRVNGVNPDGVVRDSGIFTGEWLEERARIHGVAPDKLPELYAKRTLLGVEVWPEHVADAVAVLVEGGLSRTTGHILPVDGGVAAAFLR